jgi:hypothetical protein
MNVSLEGDAEEEKSLKRSAFVTRREERNQQQSVPSDEFKSTAPSVTEQSHLDFFVDDDDDYDEGTADDKKEDGKTTNAQPKQETRPPQHEPVHAVKSVLRLTREHNAEAEDNSASDDDSVSEEGEFARAMEIAAVNTADSHRALDLVAAFHTICTRRLRAIARALSTPHRADNSVARLRLQRDYDLLRAERSTWSLLHGLLHERFRAKDMPNHNVSPLVSPRVLSSEAQLVQYLLATVPNLRRLQVVVAWLEREYALTRQEFGLSMKTMPEQAAWQRTVAQWKQTSGTALRTPQHHQPRQQLRAHPDWLARFSSVTHSLDREVDAELCARLWVALRCGRLHTEFPSDDEVLSEVTAAHDLALSAGQPWRAASLLGALPTQDPFLTSPSQSTLSLSSASNAVPHTSVSGNPYRSLFRQTAQLVTSTKDSSLNVHECALYGALCGNLNAMLMACETWEDHLWAHCKVALDTRLEVELTAHPLPLLAEEDDESENAHTTVEKVEEREGQQTTSLAMSKGAVGSSEATPQGVLREILECLRASPQADVRQAATSPYRQIQAWCLTDEWVTLTHHLAQWVQRKEADKPTCPAPLLRFATHLIYLLTSLEFLPTVSTENAPIYQSLNAIRTAYIDHLIATRQFSFIAQYTSQLPRELQVPVYAKFLIRLDAASEPLARETREDALRRAAQYGLDVDAITSYLVTQLLQPSTADATVSPVTQPLQGDSDETPLAAAVRAQLTSLEWLCVVPTQRVEALLHANALVRRFLLHDDVRAAFEVFRTLERVLHPSSTATLEQTRTVNTVSATSGEEESSMNDVVAGSQLPLLLEISPDEPRPFVQDALREHVGLYNYLQAIQALQQWMKHHAQQPRAPPPPPVNASYAATLAHSLAVQQYTAERAAWLAESQRLSDLAQRAFYRVLVFPHGWLRDKNTTEIETVDRTPTSLQSVSATTTIKEGRVRQQELDALRRRCGPALFFGLHRVLHETGHQEELCLQLAHLLIDPKYLWWTCFTTEELQKMLALFRDSVLHLLDSKGDPLP